jgi:hypothetical protein
MMFEAIDLLSKILVSVSDKKKTVAVEERRIPRRPVSSVLV